jgi:SAM-dependent methyltransferase
MQLADLADCPICKGAHVCIGNVPTICPTSGTRLDLRACKKCGHWWHSPVPDQATLLDMYASGSPYVVGPDSASFLADSKPMDSFDRFALRIMGTLKPARYLEIGAGGGQMMRRARSMGFDCYGVDPGQRIREPAIKRSLDEFPEELTFSVFLLKDVIEHVLDPLALLRHLRKRAESNAIAIASFPCCDSKPARRLGTRWSMIRPYGHLHYFSRRSAFELFTRAEWKIEAEYLARVQTVWQLASRFKVRALAYQMLGGGPDQLHVHASI